MRCAKPAPGARTSGRPRNGSAQQRADAGVSLGETLADVDGLTAASRGLPAEALHRAVSLGWADRMMAPRPSVFDPLTGLVSQDYLRTRMGEVYRSGRRGRQQGSLPPTRWSLSGSTSPAETGWDRITPLILSGDAMRKAFSTEAKL